MTQLIVVCGWPMSGKTTVSKALRDALGCHYVDADDVLVLNFGPPNPKPVTEEGMKEDVMRVGRTYQLLLQAVRLNLEMDKSLIISATFSRAVGWQNLAKVTADFPGVDLKVVWCKPSGDSDGEIANRLGQRRFGENCWSSVNTEDRYKAGRDRFEPPIPEHLVVDTSPPHTPSDSVALALDYVRG